MATVLRMPEVLANTGQAVIQTWLVSVGQQIAVGDPLAEIETDKALVEYASEVEGTLVKLIAEPGAIITVGEAIAVILGPGETEADIDPDLLGAPAPETAPASEPTLISEPEPGPVPNGRRLFATPLVRKLARERGVALEALTGTGPGGRIVRRDLDRLPVSASAVIPNPKAAAIADRVRSSAPTAPSVAPVAEPGYSDVPLTGMRKAIAGRLTESKTTIPHFYVTAHCQVDRLIDLRRTVNDAADRKVSLNDFVLKAVAGALVEVPEANAMWNGDSIRRFAGVDIAIAVAVEGGLLTPVLRRVHATPLTILSAQVADVAERARTGRIHQHELQGGSFSVSNLGMFGVTEFSAILNPPQAGILAVGAATPRPVVIDGTLTVGTVMTVTLSADHRVVDGFVAAQWMAAFVRRIEKPMSILI
jgi:pyruvate dehydrogenase E2 component (dihydrolipoyllysine-residue acetyltransferase)